MEELLKNIENMVTGLTVASWFCFLCLFFIAVSIFVNEYYKNKEKVREELEKSIRKELENK